MAFAYDDLSDDDRERFGRMRDESLKGAKEYSQSWPDPVALPEGEVLVLSRHSPHTLAWRRLRSALFSL